MNKTEEGEHARWGAQTSYSPVTTFSVPATPPWRLICVADPKWHGRGEAFSAWGAGTRTVPCGLSPSRSLSCANAYLTLMIFQFSFPMLWSASSWFPSTLPLTSSICFPLSLFLSPLPSPRPVLPSSRSLFLLGFSSLCFSLLSLFCTFVRWVSYGRSSTVMGIATPLQLVLG